MPHISIHKQEKQTILVRYKQPVFPTTYFRGGIRDVMKNSRLTILRFALLFSIGLALFGTNDHARKFYIFSVIVQHPRIPYDRNS
jgi:hypothetical protein